MKGPRKRKCRSPGRQRANIEGSASDGARGRGNCELLGTDCALTVLGGQAVVMLQERCKPNLVEAGGVGRIAISARGGGYV